MKLIKQLVLLVVTVAVLFGVNVFTAPVIEANKAAANLGPLKEVMPEATGFETIYDVNDPAASTLTDVPETVVQVIEETSGLGYIVRLSTTQGYTHEPIEFTVAVGTDGKISNVLLTAYPETKDFGVDTYPQTYIGQDSALADAQIVAGVTFSSSAFKNAVSDGLGALIANDVIKAGVKSDDQILTELLPNVATAFANGFGSAQLEEISASFATKAFKALNGNAAAYVVGSNLIVVNASGVAVVYDTEGNVVSADTSAAVADAANVVAKATSKEVKKANSLLGVENAEEVAVGTFNSVVAAYKANGQYCFVARPYHFSNEAVSYYYVVNEDGTIDQMTAAEFILEAEFFTAYTLDEPSYKAGFVGMSADTYSDDVCLVSGATFSTNAAQVSVQDVFEAFASVKGE